MIDKTAYILFALLMIYTIYRLLKTDKIRSTIDWNSVTVDDEVTVDGFDGRYYLKDGREITWIDSEGQKAIDYLNTLIKK